MNYPTASSWISKWVFYPSCCSPEQRDLHYNPTSCGEL